VESCREYRKNRLIHKARAYAELKTVRQELGPVRRKQTCPIRQEAHMYIRRIKGPPFRDLARWHDHDPGRSSPPKTRRWVASRKAAVVRAVDHGLITEAEAQETWDLSEEELEAGAVRSAPRRGRAQGHGFAAVPRSKVATENLKSFPNSPKSGSSVRNFRGVSNQWLTISPQIGVEHRENRRRMMRVLLVEDDPTTSRSIEMMLATRI
jgi:hypothetical protein